MRGQRRASVRALRPTRKTIIRHAAWVQCRQTLDFESAAVAEHVLDAAVLAHLEPLERLAPEHAMGTELLDHALDDAARREGLAAGDALEGRLLVQRPDAPALLGVEDQPRGEADRPLRTRALAQSTLNAAPLGEIEAGEDDAADMGFEFPGLV